MIARTTPLYKSSGRAPTGSAAPTAAVFCRCNPHAVRVCRDPGIRTNAFTHTQAAGICQGNTLCTPLFVSPDGSLRQFGKIAANPAWNQSIAGAMTSNYSDNRFSYGTPPQLDSYH